MIIYDCEVFPCYWLVVAIDPSTGEKNIIETRDALVKFFHAHKDEIWVGYNNVRYDQYILKAILLGYNPYHVSSFIINQGGEGWRYSDRFREIRTIQYDCMERTDRGLKYFEGSFGDDIRETEVPFDYAGELTEEQREQTICYCIHDAEETQKLFLARKDNFLAVSGLIRMFNLPADSIAKTKVQISTQILEARKTAFGDEWDIDFPPTLRLRKYASIVDWFKQSAEKMDYSAHLDIPIAGVPHTLAWGGLHGAVPNYGCDSGLFINMDVQSLYPSLMIRYGLISRACNGKIFEDIVKKRLELKAKKDSRNKALKIVINGTYGASKDEKSPLYDPRQANRVCIYGQTLMVDLIEHLEGSCDLIQSNTDGLLVRVSDKEHEETVRKIAHEWEERVGLSLEFDTYKAVYQKDVNNYVAVAPDGHLKTKGVYVKEIGILDHDLAIVNKAVVENLVNGTPVEDTINGCNDLWDFQMVKKLSGKYISFYHGTRKIPEKCIRIFASKYYADQGVLKRKERKYEKVDNTPVHSRIVNEPVKGVPVPEWLDRGWYVKLAKKRLADFFGKDETQCSQLTLV